MFPRDDKTAVKYLRLDMPARKDHNARMESLAESIQEDDQDAGVIQYRKDVAEGNFVIPGLARAYESKLKRLQQKITLKETAENFVAAGKAGLGYVFAGSGFRTTAAKPEAQLDWALVHIQQHRLAPNKVIYLASTALSPLLGANVTYAGRFHQLVLTLAKWPRSSLAAWFSTNKKPT